MRYFILIFMAFMAGGCTFKGKLNSVKYWTEDYYMTIGDTVYSPLFRKDRINPEHLAWLDAEPAIDDYEQARLYALLLHENRHAEQQKGLLTWPWYAIRYNLNREFRWKLESEAYKIEVETLNRMGYWNDRIRDSFAGFMAQHYNGMIEQADAVTWLNSITEGR